MESFRLSEAEERIKIVALLFFIFFCFLLFRLFYLQVIRGESFKKVAEANRTALFFERAPRGRIIDREEKILADNNPSFVVFFAPFNLKNEKQETFYAILSCILKLKEEDLKLKLKGAFKHGSMIRLAEHLSKDSAFSILEHRPELPGVSIVTEMQRRYPQGRAASHLVGYLGKVSEVDLRELAFEGAYGELLIGKMGLEKIFDSFLRGKHGGLRMEVDALGRSLRILDRKKTVSGYEIKTTIDLKIQKAAEEALEKQGKPGAVVAISPKTGEILAFASYPSFDPNVFIEGSLTKTDHSMPQELLERKYLPFFNRAIQATYPAGSIFKIIVAASALEARKVTGTQNFYCPGYYILGGQGGKKFYCWKKEGHGLVNLEQAIEQSCNVYFYHLGLRVGPDLIEAMAKKFNLGSATGIELQGEKNGFIPGRSMFKGGRRRWFDGDTLNFSIGQGTVLFTPLQAAQMIAIVANRGKVVRPYFWLEIKKPEGEIVSVNKPQLLDQVILSDETWNFLSHALSLVVDQGTGQAAKVDGIKIAGKTGTAQNPHGKDHAWFVAYAPVENPKIALSVFVEHGIKGSAAAAPIAREVLSAAFDRELEIKKPDSKALLPEDFE